MTPNEHYLEAERLLDVALDGTARNVELALEHAKVHALLANATSWTTKR